MRFLLLRLLLRLLPVASAPGCNIYIIYAYIHNIYAYNNGYISIMYNVYIQ